MEVDLFDYLAAAEFQRAGLPPCRQKLEQVGDTHGG